MFKKLHTFFLKLPWRDKSTAVKVVFLLVWSRLLIKSSSFRKLAEKMGSTDEIEMIPISPDELKRAQTIGRLIRSVSNYMPFRTLCFEQALTAAMFLKKGRITYRIHFGMKKHWSDMGQMKAHAWLICGDEIITGKKGHRQFEVLSTFYYAPQVIEAEIT